MNIDDMVRQTLHSYADDAPPNAGLVDAAQARARQRRVRHAGVTVAAVVAAGLLAISIPFGASGGEGPTAPGSDPPSFPPVDLVAPDFDLPSFPFTPGWTPDGIEPPYLAYNQYFGAWSLPRDLSDGGAVYGPSAPLLGLIHPPATESGPMPLIAEVHTEDPTPELEPYAEEPVTVHGRPGMRYLVQDFVEFVAVAWQHEPDLWVLVRGAGLNAADVERYAAELEETPIHPEAPFTFDLLPAGVELTGLEQESMSLHRQDGVSVHVSITRPADYPTGTPEPSDLPSGSPEPSGPVATPTGEVGLPSPPPPRPIPTQVAGRPAELLKWSEHTELRIQLGSGGILNVTGFQMNPEDLMRLAESIEITHP